MYHGRFKGTHYEAGYKFGSTLRKHGIVISSSPTFTITEERIWIILFLAETVTFW